MKILGCLLALVVSVSCTGFGFGGPGAGFSAFAGVGKSKGFGPYPGPPFPYFPIPVPVQAVAPAPPPQTHIIKVIHEHVNAPSPSKVVKVVHQHHKLAIPTVHEHVKVIQDGPAPWISGGGGDIPIIQAEPFPIGQQFGPILPAGPPVPFESGLQVLDGSSHIHEHGNIID